MNFINAVNRFLATSIGLLNALLAIVLVLFSTVVFVDLIGGLGIIVGPLVGAALAVVLCGALAVLINIRDLLAASLDRPAPSADRSPGA